MAAVNYLEVLKRYPVPERVARIGCASIHFGSDGVTRVYCAPPFKGATIMKTFLTIAVAVLVFSLAVLNFGWRTEKSVLAASGDVPPTVVKGAQIVTIFHGAGGVTTETFEIEEIRGTWVRVKAVKNEVWSTGIELVWLNLGAIDQVAIIPTRASTYKMTIARLAVS
jgi:hypothetical protein